MITPVNIAWVIFFVDVFFSAEEMAIFICMSKHFVHIFGSSEYPQHMV